MDQNKIGACIEKYRKEKGLTQQQLADVLGISNTAVSKWEHGYNLPDISMLEPLSKALEIDMLELITAQNNTHEDYTKKIQKIKKTKIRRTIILSLIFLSIVCITNILTYKKVSSKKDEELNDNIEIYQVYSPSKYFVIEGYVIFNSKENKIFLEKVEYQGTDYTDLNYSKYIEAKYYIKINKEVVLKVTQKIDNESKYNELNDLLAHLNLGANDAVLDLKKFNNNFKEVTLVVELIKNDDKKDIIEVELDLKKDFI